jgi:hypothetical protein
MLSFRSASGWPEGARWGGWAAAGSYAGWAATAVAAGAWRGAPVGWDAAAPPGVDGAPGADDDAGPAPAGASPERVFGSVPMVQTPGVLSRA